MITTIPLSTFVSVLAFLAIVGQAHARPREEARVDLSHYELIAVTVSNQAEFNTLLELEDESQEIQIWSDRPTLGEIQVRVAKNRTSELNRLGLTYRVIVPDLQLHYDELLRAQGTDDPCAYMELDAVYDRIESIAAGSPLADIVSLGFSSQERPLLALRISGSPEEKVGVFYHGAQHGNEWGGTLTLLNVADYLIENYGVLPEVTELVDNVEFFLLPVMNPDGYIRYGRHNAHGVDLNRNWDGPAGQTASGPWVFSEPETAAIRDFFEQHPNVRVHVDLHQSGGMIMWPWGYKAGFTRDHHTLELVAQRMQDRMVAAGKPPYTIGSLSSFGQLLGVAIDYSYHELGLWAFTFELNYDCQESRPALLYLSEWISDCNANQVVDNLDISLGTSLDCNQNSVPDECEYQGDCDNDGTLDICTIASGAALDCNANNVLDSCDVLSGASEDCNQDLIPDECGANCNYNIWHDACDIVEGRSLDCNDDGVPDECQGDCNNNRIPDDCDIAAGLSIDCDLDGQPDECQTDCNANGVPDTCDLIAGTATDDNANGVPDTCEDIWYVDDDGSQDGDGRSWETAFRYLDDALDVAERGDTIRIAGGTYRPGRGGMDRQVPFRLRSGVRLLGGYAGIGSEDPNLRDWAQFESMLGGDLADNDSGPPLSDCCILHDQPGCSDSKCTYEICRIFPECCSVGWGQICVDYAAIYSECVPICQTTFENATHVLVLSSADDTTLVEGLTISGAYADRRGTNSLSGAGVLISNGAPTFKHCKIAANYAERDGGGVWVQRVAGARFENCEFLRNDALRSAAAVYNKESEIQFVRCRFEENGQTGKSSAVVNEDSLVRFEQCIFRGNFGHIGGAISNFDSAVQITSSQFFINSAIGDTSRAGALANNGFTRGLVRDSLFVANASEGQAGAVSNGYYDPNVSYVGCTFVGNSARAVGGAILTNDFAPSVRNSVFWNNTDETGTTENVQIHSNELFGTEPPVVEHSLVQGWSGSWGGLGNFDADPRFVDPIGPDGIPATGDEDYRLMPDSPAINAGVVTNDTLAVDLDGHPRVLCGAIDLGPYEFGLGDHNCDRTVNLLDFSAWPSCMSGPGGDAAYPDCEPFDANTNGAIDLVDFKAFEHAFMR